MYQFQCRVYYEDTDAGGVVYYANYLKFAERARTEMLREVGINQTALAEQEDIFFVVRHVEMDLKAPARLDDLLDITTEVITLSGAKFSVRQVIKKADIILVQLEVQVVSITSAFKPVRVPDMIIEKLQLT